MQTTEAKRELIRRLAELQGRLHEIEHTLESHNTRDWEELAVEREGDEVLEDLGNAGKAEIAQIRAALARIEDGTYGDCAKCGDPISAERLETLPATPFCKNCAT